jgi:hypothetical protein
MRSVSVLILISLIVFSGCSTLEEHKGATVGAGAGAATGAVIGGLAGRNVTGAVVGGLIGGLVGGAVGHYAYDRQKDREATARDLNYDPARGTILRIEDATVTPETIYAGEQVRIKLTYAVLNPRRDAQTKVVETREITHRGQVVGRPEITVTRLDGTYTSTIPVTLPRSAPPGEYVVTNIVQAGNLTDVREVHFRVR